MALKPPVTVVRNSRLPVVNDEMHYEGDIVEAWGNITAQTLVHRFWMTLTKGGYVDKEGAPNPSKPITVVVLTTSNAERDRVEAFKLNVAGYLLKPVTNRQFAEVMTTINKYWGLMEMP